MPRIVIQTRVNPKEKDAFAELAKQLDYDTPSALNRALIREAINCYPHLDKSRLRLIRDLTYQIRQVGGNINQMTHAMHMNERPDDDQLLQAMADVYDLLKETLTAYNKLIKSSRKRIVKAAR